LSSDDDARHTAFDRAIWTLAGRVERFQRRRVDRLADLLWFAGLIALFVARRLVGGFAGGRRGLGRQILRRLVVPGLDVRFSSSIRLGRLALRLVNAVFCLVDNVLGLGFRLPELVYLVRVGQYLDGRQPVRAPLLLGDRADRSDIQLCGDILSTAVSDDQLLDTPYVIHEF
jgi:hypothetical protein